MKYKFNETNIMTGYIKELLHEFNLPKYKVYQEGKRLYDGEFYIKDGYICKYINSEFIKISPFKNIKKSLNVTNNLIINSSSYDTYTHEYLGNYLRYIRDFNKINLMPLYNCFSYSQPEKIQEKIYFNNEKTSFININVWDTNYSYYIIPVKFNETYSIYIDSHKQYELASLIYTGNKLLDLNLGQEGLISKTYKKVPGSKFSEPIIYSTNIDASKYIKYEDNLKLLLKIPTNVKSSIVILEGNYYFNTTSGGLISQDKVPYQNPDTTPITRLSLCSINDGISYPFADRLVEYLLKNSITRNETIKNNIGRIQNGLYKNSKFKGLYDIWTDELMMDILNLSFVENKFILDKNKKTKFGDCYNDLIGYIDKDLEYKITTDYFSNKE